MSSTNPYLPLCPTSCVPEISIPSGLDTGTFSSNGYPYVLPGLSAGALIGIVLASNIFIVFLVLVIVYTVGSRSKSLY